MANIKNVSIAITKTDFPKTKGKERADTVTNKVKVIQPENFEAGREATVGILYAITTYSKILLDRISKNDDQMLDASFDNVNESHIPANAYISTLAECALALRDAVSRFDKLSKDEKEMMDDVDHYTYGLAMSLVAKKFQEDDDDEDEDDIKDDDELAKALMDAVDKCLKSH